MAFQLTAEQEEILAHARKGQDLVLVARAGTGKTSTLEAIANDRPRTKFLYLAYNKAIQLEAASRFPTNAKCKTAHSLAWFPFGKNTDHRRNIRMSAQQTAKVLGLTHLGAIRIDKDRVLSPQQLGKIALQTVTRFCHSADAEITGYHVPRLPGFEDDDAMAVLRREAVPAARRAWADINASTGSLRVTHDHYLKMFALSKPRLRYDVILFDEGQDANPAIASLVKDQAQYGTQVILVGDDCQAIYGWRGAVDALANFAGTRLFLSQSFRFGPAVAATANRFLDLLGADPKVRGFSEILSRVEEVTDPDAVLCRTNSGAMVQVLRFLEEGKRVAMVGGGREIKAFAEAALDLKAGRPTNHPELMAFITWGQVQEYVEQAADGSDLKVLVDLVDAYDPDVLIDAVNRLVDERRADVVVCTAHKSKGLEWNAVLIHDDFREPKDGEVPADEELRLAYVTVTRAKKRLDLGGLSWINDYRAA
jgi:AAA domain/UvrD-like helicase C-terminal domain